MVLDYTAYGYVVYRLGRSILHALPNPRRFEEERLRKFRKGNVWQHMRRAILDFVLVGGACLVAWRHADFGFVWLAFAIVLISLAIPIAFAWTFNKLNPVSAVESFPLPTEEQLERLARSRIRICAVQFALVIAWTYSWRHLFF